MKKLIFSTLLATASYAGWLTAEEETIDINSYSPQEQVVETSFPKEPVQQYQEVWPVETSFPKESAQQHRELQIVDTSPISIDILSRIKSDKNFKVALLVPKRVIGRYAKKVSNSILAYLIYRGSSFEYEVFDSVDESEISIITALQKIRNKGYNFIIAPYTLKGANLISRYEDRAVVYIPTIHSKDVNFRSNNIIFGGIDYKAQINKLLDYTNDKLSVFSGKSDLASRLTSYVSEHSYQKDVYIKPIDNARVNLKYIIKNNHRLKNSSIFLNMPLVSSALITSSLSNFSIEPFGIFSTQINYSPLLFSLMQKKDRKNFYLANSIGYINSKLNDIDQNFGNKIKYDWISYSTSIGLDHVYAKYNSKDKLFNEELENNQIKYRTKIVKIDGDEFKRVD